MSREDEEPRNDESTGECVLALRGGRLTCVLDHEHPHRLVDHDYWTDPR